jgi:peptidoglycan L-alanyl-D-glutamate endopeptidase CwlK
MTLYRGERLKGLHPDLVRVVNRAHGLAPWPVAVLEGLRTLERQRQLMKSGDTTTLNSRHLTGHAVDLAPMFDTDGDGDVEVSWAWPKYHLLAAVVKQAAAEERVPIEWGGDWKTFKDGPHWQLPWKQYPK